MTMPARITRRSSRLLNISNNSISTKASANNKISTASKNCIRAALEESRATQVDCELDGAKTDSMPAHVMIVIAEVHVDACPDDYFDCSEITAFADKTCSADEPMTDPLLIEPGVEPMILEADESGDAAAGDEAGEKTVGCTDLSDNPCLGVEHRCTDSESNRVPKPKVSFDENKNTIIDEDIDAKCCNDKDGNADKQSNDSEEEISEFKFVPYPWFSKIPVDIVEKGGLMTKRSVPKKPRKKKEQQQKEDVISDELIEQEFKLFMRSLRRIKPIDA